MSTDDGHTPTPDLDTATHDAKDLARRFEAQRDELLGIVEELRTERDQYAAEVEQLRIWYRVKIAALDAANADARQLRSRLAALRAGRAGHADPPAVDAAEPRSHTDPPPGHGEAETAHGDPTAGDGQA